MKLLDRYILRLFVKVLLACLVTMTGMYVVIDAFNNIDEFISYGKDGGGVLGVLWNYYSAHALTFVDSMAGVLALIAAMFTVTLMQRQHELTALMAAGIPTSRIVTPLLAATIAVSVIGTANREILIPSKRDILARNAQDWRGERARPVTPQFDHRTNVRLDGRNTFANEQRVALPNFRLPRSLHHVSRSLSAENAFYQPAHGDRPGGYLLDRVEPASVTQRGTVMLNEQPVLLTPAGTSWLEPQQCFLISDVDFVQLSSGESWRRNSSSWALIKALHNPSLDFGADVRVTVHARIVQPILDVILLFLGLPLVLTRRNRNVSVAIGKCLFVVAAFRLVVMGSQHLGGAYLLSPAFAAWLPIMVFGPVAVFMSQTLWE